MNEASNVDRVLKRLVSLSFGNGGYLILSNDASIVVNLASVIKAALVSICRLRPKLDVARDRSHIVRG